MTNWWQSSQRFRIEKWLWIVVSLVVLLLAWLFAKFWQQISIAYLAFVSNYALVISAAGAEQAAKAKEEERKKDHD